MARQSGPRTVKTIKSMCPMNCHPTYCGMTIQVEDGRVTKTTGDPENADSRGFLCLRGRAAHEVIYNEQRLKRPLRRIGPRGQASFEEIDWEDALDIAAERMRKAGRERVAIWPGHGAIVNTTSYLLEQRFGHVYGCQLWNPAIICWSFGGMGAGLTGVLEANTKEDLGEHSDLIILWGANLASQPTTTPHVIKARRRGARVVTIDVRRTEAAQHSDEFLRIRPGSDAALALAMAQVLIEEELADSKFIEQHSLGYAEFAESVRDKTPEWAAPITGLPADRIRDLARLYGSRKPGIIVMGGASMYKSRNGWLSSRAITCLPALTGQLGVAGGGLGPRHRAFIRGETLANISGRELRPEGNYIPSHMGSIAEALRDGKVDVLLLLGTNMLSGFADANEIGRALMKLDFILAHDLFLQETARDYADIILPGTSWVEETGFKQTLTHVYLMDQAIEPLWEARPLSAVLRGLAARLDLPEFFPWADQIEAVNAVLDPVGGGGLTVDRLRGQGGAQELRVSHVAYPDRQFHTPSGKVEFFSQRAVEVGLPALPAYEPPGETAPDSPLAERYPLIFKQGRTFTHFHGFYLSGQALPSLAQADPEPTLWIHPADAAARSIQSGDPIDLFNNRGSFPAKAKVTEDIGPGVVFMRDGWIGVNQLTSGESALPLEANEVTGFPAGQAAYEARVEVRRQSVGTAAVGSRAQGAESGE